jgi:signal transduction histidine kinase
MIGIRQKLALGFGGLLAIVVVIGVMTVSHLDDLGHAIDVILKENYTSVVACQNMNEALERMDSGVLFTLAGHKEEGLALIRDNEERFKAALASELRNVTIPTERQKALRIEELFGRYTESIPHVTDDTRPLQQRSEAYFDTVLTLFQGIKTLTHEILEMNQTSMSRANDEARALAASTYRETIIAVAAFALIAVLFSYLVHRWVLKPVKALTESAGEISRGNLDLVLETGASDEIGKLSESFNEMAASLRQTRKSDMERLVRTKRAMEGIMKALPDAVAIVDPGGRVEFSTEAAERFFGLSPGARVGDLGFDWLPPLIERALSSGGAAVSAPGIESVQRFYNGEEHFFRPFAVPVPHAPGSPEPAGAALILEDVTRLREQEELKRGVVSTVSHQLKTPLTSLRMCVYILLEEKIGTLNAKQAELLAAAREDGDRLSGMLADLLDINRIESEKTPHDAAPHSPRSLVRDAVESFLAEARDRGVDIVNAVPDDLPDVTASESGIRHVFGNLVSNALRFTRPGGTVTLGAEANGGYVRFTVEDTGEGIAPEYLPKVYEQFYRAPGQDDSSGVGLGLAIVKEIVEAHGGSVGVRSERGKGSVFEFSLPAGNGSVNTRGNTHGEA